ncbi:ribonuclease-3 [Brevinema andersonii]|uniref:Ribonuclease 3 n=1 Tax=Brevinema andersonii TaxID=34097 RepID=A0A1I1D718_BREAD|nr:ribonuclease III [Brevinema andersonii]SFB70594.1 ribonuclease-3 [Brevinema andersonii]
MFRLFSKKSSLDSKRITVLKKHCMRFGIKVKNFEMLDLALTHISYSNGESNDSYERLEFLGDSVFGLCIAKILYVNFPQFSEGKMSALKSNLADEKTLAEVSEELKLLDLIKLGGGEKLNDYRAQQKVLCDIFESVLAVIFLDSGLAECEKFIYRLFFERILLFKNEGIHDFKTRLQKITVKGLRHYPQYTIVDTEGPDHGKIFTVAAEVGSFFATAKGRSKKEAEQGAAKKILEQIKIYATEDPHSAIAKEFKATEDDYSV